MTERITHWLRCLSCRAELRVPAVPFACPECGGALMSVGYMVTR